MKTIETPNCHAGDHPAERVWRELDPRRGQVDVPSCMRHKPKGRVHLISVLPLPGVPETPQEEALEALKIARELHERFVTDNRYVSDQFDEMLAKAIHRLESPDAPARFTCKECDKPFHSVGAYGRHVDDGHNDEHGVDFVKNYRTHGRI